VRDLLLADKYAAGQHEAEDFSPLRSLEMTISVCYSLLDSVGGAAATDSSTYPADDGMLTRI